MSATRLLPVAWIMWSDESGRSGNMLGDDSTYNWEDLRRIIAYDVHSRFSNSTPLALGLLTSLRSTAQELTQ